MLYIVNFRPLTRNNNVIIRIFIKNNNINNYNLSIKITL